jgi:hypothetical protein
MSIAGDLLTTATPARLLCRRGIWVLELVKLVPVDRNVFQPRVQRLEGSEAVLQHLKRNGDNPALAAAASQLMRGFKPDEDRAFEAVDGDWVPGEPGPKRESTRPSAPPPGGNISGEVAELRAELLVLRASHERLRERVVRLESLLSTGGAPPRDLISVVPTPSIGLPDASDLPRGPEPFAAAARGAEAFAATLAHSQAPSISEAPQPRSVEPKPKLSQPAVGAGLRLPPAEAVSACLQSLVGEQLDTREARSATFSATAAGPCWVSRLIDDEGREVGAIVADLQATTALGAALLNLDASEIQAQRAARAPSEDVISAMSEVANNISGTINQDASGTQVRVKPIEPLSPGLLDWAKAPRQCVGLEVETDGGRLFLLAR